MNIAFIFIPNFGAGGAERVAVKVANDWAKIMEVYILVGNDKGPMRKELLKKVRVIDMKKKKFSTSIPSIIFYLKRMKPTVCLFLTNGISSCVYHTFFQVVLVD